MKKMITLFSLLLMSTAAFANDTFNDKYSQQELQQLLSNSPRCVLNAVDESAKNIKVSIVKGQTTSDEVYFAEITNSKGQTSILHLVKVGLQFGGYKLEAKSGLPYIGLEITGSVNFLSQTSKEKSYDASVTLKSGLLRTNAKYYNRCK